MENVTIQVIARMHSDFPSKFGIPRQSGLVEALQSIIVFEPEYRKETQHNINNCTLTCSGSTNHSYRCTNWYGHICMSEDILICIWICEGDISQFYCIFEG